MAQQLTMTSNPQSKAIIGAHPGPFFTITFRMISSLRVSATIANFFSFPAAINRPCNVFTGIAHNRALIGREDFTGYLQEHLAKRIGAEFADPRMSFNSLLICEQRFIEA